MGQTQEMVPFDTTITPHATLGMASGTRGHSCFDLVYWIASHSIVLHFGQAALNCDRVASFLTVQSRHLFVIGPRAIRLEIETRHRT